MKNTLFFQIGKGTRARHPVPIGISTKLICRFVVFAVLLTALALGETQKAAAQTATIATGDYTFTSVESDSQATDFNMTPSSSTLHGPNNAGTYFQLGGDVGIEYDMGLPANIVQKDSFALNGKTLTLGAASGQAVTITGAITGETGILKIDTKEDITLSGSNTFAGGIGLNGGTLVAAGVNALGSTATGINSAITFNGGKLKIEDNNATYRDVIMTKDGSIEVVTDETFSIGGNLTGAGTLTKTGAGTLNFAGNNTSTSVTIKGGVFQFLNTDNSKTFAGNISIDGANSGFAHSKGKITSTVTFGSNGGTYFAAGDGAYSGTMNLSGGTLLVNVAYDANGSVTPGTTTTDFSGATINNINSGKIIAYISPNADTSALADQELIFTGITAPADFSGAKVSADIDGYNFVYLPGSATSTGWFFQSVALDIPEFGAFASQMHRYDAVRLATRDHISDHFAKYGDYQNRSTRRQTTATQRDTIGILGQSKQKCPTSSAWVNWVGRSNDSFYSTALQRNMDFTSNGVQLGVNMFGDQCSLFGVMFGYEEQKLDANDGGSRLKADDFYFGAYGARRFRSGWDIRGVLAYGHQDFDMTRVRASTGAQLKGEFGADTFEASFELGHRVHSSRNVSWRPVLGFDFYNYDADGTDENGLNGVKYSDTSLTQLYMRMGTDLQVRACQWDITAGAYYSHQLLSDGDTSVQYINRGNGVAKSAYDLGNSVVTANLGASWYLNTFRTLAVYGTYNVDLYTDRVGDPVQHTGIVGVHWSF